MLLRWYTEPWDHISIMMKEIIECRKECQVKSLLWKKAVEIALFIGKFYII